MLDVCSASSNNFFIVKITTVMHIPTSVSVLDPA